MPFQKGRAKTGGRQKGSVAAEKRSSKFVEQLKGHGFNYPRELAEVLLEIKALRKTKVEPTGDEKKDAAARIERMNRLEELKFYYGELKSLLAWMVPKLREKEVEVSAEPETPATPPAAPISDEALLKVLNGQSTTDHPRTSNPPVLGAGSAVVQVQGSTEENLQSLAGEQEEDS